MKKHNHQQKMLSRIELSIRWGVSVATVKRREIAGILTRIVIGARSIRYMLDEIEAIERGQRH